MRRNLVFDQSLNQTSSQFTTPNERSNPEIKRSSSPWIGSSPKANISLAPQLSSNMTLTPKKWINGQKLPSLDSSQSPSTYTSKLDFSRNRPHYNNADAAYQRNLTPMHLKFPLINDERFLREQLELKLNQHQ